jgi:hypothetical protein
VVLHCSGLSNLRQGAATTVTWYRRLATTSSATIMPQSICRPLEKILALANVCLLFLPLAQEQPGKHLELVLDVFQLPLQCHSMRLIVSASFISIDLKINCQLLCLLSCCLICLLFVCFSSIRLLILIIHILNNIINNDAPRNSLAISIAIPGIFFLLLSPQQLALHVQALLPSTMKCPEKSDFTRAEGGYL